MRLSFRHDGYVYGEEMNKIKPKYAILKDKKAVPAKDVYEWGLAFDDTESRRVASTTISTMHVSTVFLGINHNFDPSGPPFWFETMVFGGKYDDYTERYETWDAAEAGHKKIVDMVKGDL